MVFAADISEFACIVSEAAATSIASDSDVMA
jgi:hypothetical protein